MATLFDRLFLQPVCLWPCPYVEMNRQSFTYGVIAELEKVVQNPNITDVKLVRTTLEACEPSQATGFSARIGRFDQFSLALPLTVQKIRGLVQPMFEAVCEVPTIEWLGMIFVFLQMNGQKLEVPAIINPKSIPLLC